MIALFQYSSGYIFADWWCFFLFYFSKHLYALFILILQKNIFLCDSNQIFLYTETYGKDLKVIWYFNIAYKLASIALIDRYLFHIELFHLYFRGLIIFNSQLHRRKRLAYTTCYLSIWSCALLQNSHRNTSNCKFFLQLIDRRDSEILN